MTVRWPGGQGDPDVGEPLAAGVGFGRPAGPGLQGARWRSLQARRGSTACAGSGTDASPADSGWPDQCWTLTRIAEIVRPASPPSPNGDNRSRTAWALGPRGSVGAASSGGPFTQYVEAMRTAAPVRQRDSSNRHRRIASVGLNLSESHPRSAELSIPASWGRNS